MSENVIPMKPFQVTTDELKILRTFLIDGIEDAHVFSDNEKVKTLQTRLAELDAEIKRRTL